MTTTYDVQCITCGVPLNIDEGNLKAMWTLICYAEALAGLAELFDRMWRADPVFHVLGDRSISLLWFVEHRGHALAVVDEYGKWVSDEECKRRVSPTDEDDAITITEEGKAALERARRMP